MFHSLLKFFNYWYMRYLLVTEFYMVEKWEMVMMHMVMFIMFSILSIFNTYAVVGVVSWGLTCLNDSPVDLGIGSSGPDF